MKLQTAFLMMFLGLVGFGCSGYQKANGKSSAGSRDNCVQSECQPASEEQPSQKPTLPNPVAPAPTPNPGPAPAAISFNPPADSAFHVASDHASSVKSNWEMCQSSSCSPGSQEYRDWEWYNNIADGPVTRIQIYVFWIERAGQLIDVESQKVNGCYQVKPGDRIMFDLNQKNSGNRECKWDQNPRWLVSSNDNDFEEVPKDGQPFLFRLKPHTNGKDAYIKADIGGVKSENILCLTTK